MPEGDVDTSTQRIVAGQTWGRPGPCPKCGSPGYLEHIDLVDRVMYQKCTDWECRNRWETAEAEVAANG